jgi:hypothetical protein
MKLLHVLALIFVALAVYVIVISAITGHVYIPYYLAPQLRHAP